jgi:hypothetical protein
MTQIFNSELEISLRVLVITNVMRAPISVDHITTIDLFSSYGKNYGFLEFNLHGDSSYSFSEIASRRYQVSQSINTLVLSGLLMPLQNAYGFTYIISEDGRKVCEKMETDYFKKYIDSVRLIIQKTQNWTDEKLINYATKESVRRE